MLAHDQARTAHARGSSTFTDRTRRRRRRRRTCTGHRCLPRSIGAELTGSRPAANRPGITNLFAFDELDAHVAALAGGGSDVPYEELAAADVDGGGAPPAGRRAGSSSTAATLYRRDDLDGARSRSARLEPRALPGELYRLALTPSHCRRASSAPRVTDATLARGRLRPARRDDWWPAPGGRLLLAERRRHAGAGARRGAARTSILPRRDVDPFGAIARVDYDDYDLLPGDDATTPSATRRAPTNDYRVARGRPR